MKVGYWAMSKICKGGGQNMFPYFRGYLLFVVCGGIPYIYSGIMSHFLYLKIGPKIYCVVYTGLYNFMKEIPVYIFHCEKKTVYIDLRCFIIDKELACL